MKDFIVTVIGISIFLLLLFYPHYSLNNSCRLGEKIIQDTELRSQLKKSLEKFVNASSFEEDLKRFRAGSIFYLSRFSADLDMDLEAIGMSKEHVELHILTNRKDKHFTRPYMIERLGIYFVHARIKYDIAETSFTGGNNLITLVEKPKFQCSSSYE